MLSIFKPAAHKARLPAAEIDPLYRRAVPVRDGVV